MTADCPVCGQSVETQDLTHSERWLICAEGRVRLGWVEDEIIRALLEEPMSTEKLIGRVYASDGGPEKARESLQVVMSRLRVRLREIGRTIANVGGRHSGAIYTLKRLEDETP